ncbi:MAG: DUF3862 domain-containing protein [Pyrinomonadaceae bacterium]|nr:DUF3862 domain-containing protein [Pyrinomonadaceae bacterium]
MKRSYTLALAVLVFVVLGCGMLGKKEEKVEIPTNTAESTPVAKDSPAKSTDSSSSSSLSMEKYEEIKNGMSYDEVAKVLGSPGEETRSSTVGKIELKSYKWEGDKYQRVYVNFRDGKVNSKSQSGLSGSTVSKDGDADITKAKYDQIKNDMSYEEVVKIIGSEGEQISNSKSGNYEYSSYAWKGPNYSRISASFRNGKLNSKSQSGLK